MGPRPLWKEPKQQIVIEFSPSLVEEHESLLADALPSRTELLGIGKDESRLIHHGCDWQFDDAQLNAVVFVAGHRVGEIET